MKICRKCNKLIPDKNLVCVACTEQASREAMRIAQVPSLRHFNDGLMQLKTIQLGGIRHLIMWGGNGDTGFCWLAVGRNSARTQYMSPTEFESATGLCPLCRREFTTQLAEAL